MYEYSITYHLNREKSTHSSLQRSAHYKVIHNILDFTVNNINVRSVGRRNSIGFLLPVT
jgi:hypothetical protein